MEDCAIVIMLKDHETGFLEKELGSYTLTQNGDGVFHIYAEDTAEGRRVVLRLSCEREVEDWEYDAIFDYYDIEPLQRLGISVVEEDGQQNPVWVITFPFSENQAEMEEILSRVLEAHRNELISVYDAIADKKDDYCEE